MSHLIKYKLILDNILMLKKFIAISDFFPAVVNTKHIEICDFFPDVANTKYF